MATTITAGNSTNGAAISSDNTGILELKTGTGSGTTAITVNASQNVGIGTSSPSVAANYKGIVIQGSTTTAGGVLQLQTSDSSYQAQIYTDNNGTTISSTGNYAMRFQTNATLQASITSAGLFQFNSGYGSVATAYGCRAWVNFNGNPVAIRASGNVTSITDNGGVGDYTVNFTNAMPDANYATVATAGDASTNLINISQNGQSFPPTTTSVRLQTMTSNGVTYDARFVNVAIFR